MVLARSTGVLFAFAEARNYSGDGCIPSGSNHSSDEGIRSLALKTSRDRGRTWGGLEIVDWHGINPAAVYDEVADQVVVHYPYTSAAASSPAGHPNYGGVHTKQVLCKPTGECGTPSSLEKDLVWRGGMPLGTPAGPIWVGAGPGLGVQLTSGPHAARLLFSGHAGQADITWFSDDHAKTWQLASTIFGNNSKDPDPLPCRPNLYP